MKRAPKPMVMTISAFVPGHITGLFRIHDSEPDTLHCGSTGAGFSVSLGTTTSVRTKEGNSLRVEVEYNGESIDAPVTTTVVRTMAEQYECKFTILVQHQSDLPVGVGFGASGAGALGTALALGKLLDAKMTPVKAAGFAHSAEIVNHTGLGDVIGQFEGGVEVRVLPGAPGIGKIVHVPYNQSMQVALAGGHGLKAKRAALVDSDWHERINRVAGDLVEEMKANPSISRFIDCSRRFADTTGLATKRVRSTLKRLDSIGLDQSGMVMLGDSVFCFCDEENSSAATEILSQEWSKNEVMVTTVAGKGGHVLS
jgi:pantoate kinase